MEVPVVVKILSSLLQTWVGMKALSLMIWELRVILGFFSVSVPRSFEL